MRTTKHGKTIRLLLACTALGALFAGCAAKDEWVVSAQETPAAITEAEENARPADMQNGPEEAALAATGESVPVKQISVHVCGAVKQPGVYAVSESARVIDAVRAAGGFTAEADEEGLNLAAFLVDGCRLRIPALGETADAPGEEPSPVMTVGLEEQPADSLVVLADGISGLDGKINLNTASEAELCTLNGIGPKRASDIVRYREEHGSFANIEEIMNVKGIKQSLFAKIREYIRV